MKIIVSGNTVVYSSAQSIIKAYYIEGEIMLNRADTILSFYNEHLQINKANGVTFTKLASEVRGCEFNNLIEVFSVNNSNKDFITYLQNITVEEIGLIKSIFNIYIWLEISLIKGHELDIENMIYDEFIIDYTGRPGKQKDIYFLSKNIVPETHPFIIKKLVNLNLLCKLEVTYGLGSHTTYFIPFSKPGIPMGDFASENDKSGEVTYKFWKKILHEREHRIRRFIHNI